MLCLISGEVIDRASRHAGNKMSKCHEGKHVLRLAYEAGICMAVVVFQGWIKGVIDLR